MPQASIDFPHVGGAHSVSFHAAWRDNQRSTAKEEHVLKKL